MKCDSVHFIGVGGVGMAALAFLLKRRGMRVSGCDCSQSARLKWLSSCGIEVSVGHDPAHAAADYAVATPAVSKDEEEVRAFLGRIRMRGEVLAEVVSEAQDSIAVCGSHGKTTTSTWIAMLLIALGESVEWAVGGETGAFPVAGFVESAGGKGASPVLVVEADESDGTLALYKAKTLVVTNCEYDHPDHFPTREEYFACYEKAMSNSGSVIESEKVSPRSCISKVVSSLPFHNAKNAAVAAEVAIRRGHGEEKVAQALEKIILQLPDRRFEKVSFSVWTDYAHHPTEIACAISMARKECRGKLRVLFQPHRYSRTKAFLKEFAAELEKADEVVLCPTYAAFEKPLEGGDVADIYALMRSSSAAKPLLAPTCMEAWEHARNSYSPGDVTLLLGAGDIVKVIPKVREDAACGFENARKMRKIILGAGTNTWISDLKTDVVYEKVEAPAGRMGASVLAQRPHLMPWMAGIPGTIGGWVKMNAGAFGHSVSEALEAVKVDGKWIAAEECGFGYRTSAIKGVIEDVRWKDDKDVSSQEMLTLDDYLARRKKFPPGTYGSFFKNPPGYFAGRLLEAAGAKGMRVGGAYVWEEHANVIVRGEGAVASDVLALARLMYLKVLTKFGVSLESEVQEIARGL